MNSINIELERAKKKFFIQRLQYELDDLDPEDQRYEIIKKIYDELTAKTQDLDSLFDAANNNVYSKKWNRLPQYHKIQKIKEYLNSKYENIEERIKIETILNNKLKDGKLNSCKIVDYDTETFVIKKITFTKNEVY
jgi:hypothetical protein